MRTRFLFVLMLAALAVGAQNTSSGDCKARFHYAIDTLTMTIAPATAVHFVDESDGHVMNWFWDFGDGETSTEQNPYHVYVHPIVTDSMLVKINPYRTITLTILTSDSCKATYSQTIDIYNVAYPGKTCKSDFYFVQTGFDSIAQTATFQFVNLESSGLATYRWNFSDGLESTDVSPEMTFDFSRAERKVCLTTLGPDGCTDELCQAVYIDTTGQSFYPGDTTQTDCFVAFGYNINYTYQTFAPALVLDFYSKADQMPLKYLWDFGDGTTSDEANPTHSFNFPLGSDSLAGNADRIRTICLTITTDNGCESTWCDSIDIYTGTQPEDRCHAWFKIYQPEGVVTIPEVVPYRFYATNDAAVSWLWTFQDGTTSTEREPFVTFDIFSGTQQVCLTTTNNEGCESTWCETIWVSPWIPDSISPEPVCDRYRFRYDSFFPIAASSCAGTVTAQVVDGENPVPVDYYYWTSETGELFVDGPTLAHMCPTQIYTVTARTADSCKFSASIVLSSDGTVTEVKRDPIVWWVNGWGDDSYIEYEVQDSSYTVEWHFCDGSVYSGVQVPLGKINCGASQPNLILKDATGNVIFSETVALRATSNPVHKTNRMLLYPNPVENELIVQMGNYERTNLYFEIANTKGQVLRRTDISTLQAGQRLSLDVSTLGQGIYIGKIVSGKQVLDTQKFVK